MKKLGLALAVLILALIVPFGVGCTNDVSSNISYNIECEIEGNTLLGNEEVKFTNFSDNVLSELKFNLFGNAFREDANFKPISSQYTSRAYPNGMSYGEMSVQKVESNNKSLEFDICGEDKNILLVKLSKELFPGETIVVSIEYKLTLADVIARTGKNSKTINLGNFYPILCGVDGNSFYECVYYSSGDPFYSDIADYKVKVAFDKQLVLATSGQLLSEKQDGDKMICEFELKKARSFAMVACADFKVVSENFSQANVCYYYYDDNQPVQSLEYAIKALKLFTEKFGEYPYPTFSVVQTKFIQGGMEYPGLVMIADDLDAKSYGEVIVHETAHQWWQTVVGNNEVEYGFLDEGLAEYSVVLFYENYPEYQMQRKNMILSAEQTYKVFCSVSDKIFGKVNTVMLRSLKQFNSEYEYVNMAYIKPCIMYDYLRESVGDELFFKGLKRYFKEYAFKNATPVDLVGVYEKIGADTNGFFDGFFNGKVII